MTLRPSRRASVSKQDGQQLGKRPRSARPVVADSLIAGRATWSHSEECMLVAAAEAAALDFDVIMDVFAGCFHSSRTPKSLRAHYYRLKRLGHAAAPSLAEMAGKVMDLWKARTGGGAGSDVAVENRGHVAALCEFTTESLLRQDDRTDDGADVSGCDVDDEDDKAQIGSVAETGHCAVEEEVDLKSGDSSDATVVTSDECKRRKLSLPSSPARPTSPLTPNSSSPRFCSTAPQAAAPSEKVEVGVSSPAVLPLSAPLSLPSDESGGPISSASTSATNSSASSGDAAAPPGPVVLSPLDTFVKDQIYSHVQALRAETFVRRFRPIIMRLYEHHLNMGVFNEPVNPITLGLPDYFTIIDVPMDLGTVRQRLEAGRYTTLDELSADVRLVFNNAIRYNPEGHAVHLAAARMLEEYESTVKKLSGKHDADKAKKAAHACSFCQGESCGLCGDKCLLFDPVVYVCDCCGDRIRRSTVFYRSGSGNRWCAKCVANGGSNCIVGGSRPPKLSRAQMLQRRKSFATPSLGSDVPTLLPPPLPPAQPASRFVLRLNLATRSLTAQEQPTPAAAAVAAVSVPEPLASPPILPPLSVSPGTDLFPVTPFESSVSPFRIALPRAACQRLEKRRNDDVVAEPWVQCDSCKQWVHQICAMFNLRKNAMTSHSAHYVCPTCRLDALEDQEIAAAKAAAPAVTPSRASKSPAVKKSMSPLMKAAASPPPPPPAPPAISSPASSVVPPVTAAANNAPSPTDLMSAASLPCTEMSREIEARVRAKMTAIAGVDAGNGLVIREVSSVPQTLEVPPALRALLTVPSPTPATVRSVLAAFMSSSDSTAPSATASRESPAPSSDSPVNSASPDTVPSAGLLSSAVTPSTTPTSSAGAATASDVVTQYPESLQYRQRVLLLFQRLDGVDVCLFGLYVQEYDASCPAPNTNRVYIAYLDSVRYLRPLQARTPVYHELLCAYMANARLRGFVGANIWACPPQRGDGYIFHCHPLQQRTPDKRRLRAWYIQLLAQAQADGVVSSVTQLADDYFAEDGTLVPEKGLPPFFAGDFWAIESERILRDIARIRANKNKGKAKSAKVSGAVTPLPSAKGLAEAFTFAPASPALPPALPMERSLSGGNRSRSRAGKPKEEDVEPPAAVMRRGSSGDLSMDGDAEGGGGGGEDDPEAPALQSFTQSDMEKFDLVKMLGKRIRDMKSDFLVVQFHPLGDADREAAAVAAANCDASQQMTCDFFDTRSGFLRMCQGNNYQVTALLLLLLLCLCLCH